MSTQGNDKKYDRDWQTIVSDLASTLQASGFGLPLRQAIERRRLDGKILWISLVCSGCGSFSASADNLDVKHLEQIPTQPSIACPRCGSDAAHVYKGLRTS